MITGADSFKPTKLQQEYIDIIKANKGNNSIEAFGEAGAKMDKPTGMDFKRSIFGFEYPVTRTFPKDSEVSAQEYVNYHTENLNLNNPSNQAL